MNTAEKDKKFIWHPFTQMKDWLKEEPVVIERGEGNCLIDDKGNRYIDGVSSLWVIVHGHNHPFINDAIKQQLDKIAHTTMLGLTNPKAAELAEKLVNIAPKGLSKVFYSDNGSTSVEIAMKMAFQYFQHKGEKLRTKFAYLNNSYHGDTLGAVSVGGIQLFHSTFKPLLFKGFKLPSPYCYRCEFGKTLETCSRECVKKSREILVKNKETIAALIMEPLVQGAAGMITQPKGYLKEIAEICKENNILMILDEVATGFGRTGKMFACEHEDVSPDFLCVAKGITGGYLPLAATLTTNEVYNAFLGEYSEFKTFFHGHTYTGNPLACAAAVANLKLFETEQTIKKMQRGIKYLSKKLEKFKSYKFVGEVRQCGYMVGVEIVKNKQTKEMFPIEDRVCIKISAKAREFGVITRPLGNVLVMMPPLSITDDEIDILCDGIYNSMLKVLE